MADSNRNDDKASDETAAAPPRWKECAAAFAAGLRRPSVIGTLGALVVAALQLLALCLLVTPRTLARIDPGYLLDNQFDVFTYSTFQIHQMRQTPARELGVLLVGSSTLREAIRDDQVMEDALTASLQEPVNFFRIPSGWQSLWETVAVVDYLPEHFHGVIVVGVDPGRMGRPRELLARWIKTPLLAIDSPHFREEIELAGLQPPRRTGVFLLDHAKFFAARKYTPLRLLGGPIQAETHFTHLVSPWPEEKWRRVETRELPEWVGNFAKHGAQNLDILRRLIQRERAAGNRLVLLETPLHPRAERACGQSYQDYLQAMREFAQQQDVPFWRLDEEAQIKEDDFTDFVHLCTYTSQLRYQTVLMNKLEPILSQMQREKRRQKLAFLPKEPS
jgi:hypothetical protein